MAGYETILTSVEGEIVLSALNRPDKLNALNSQVTEDLRAALQEFRGNDGVGVVVLPGRGRRHSWRVWR